MQNAVNERTPVSEAELNRGLRMLLYDGMCSQVMGVLTTGAFLVAFAVLLGASNTVIGLLAAVGPFAQLLQVPAIYLVTWVRRRKLLVVVSCLAGRAFWLLVAALPFFLPASARVPLLLLSMFIFFGLGAISSCAFNSWIRDLIPENIMGSYFAKRMAISTALGAALSLLAGIGVDAYKNAFATQIGAYSILFGIGAVAGLFGMYFMSRIPEPQMAAEVHSSILRMLLEPLRNVGFRQLLVFLGSWNFAVNFASPFFVVYMLNRLGLNMTWIIALAVLSQFINVLFFRIWGQLSDKFTNKSCLAVAGPLFVLTFLMWPFTTLPERYFLTIPLLVLIHVVTGVSTAGVGLCSGNIALKAAPYGSATAYLAVNAVVSGLAATVAPILAGMTADWFSAQELSVAIRWASTAGAGREFLLPALDLRGLDFIFILALLLGLYALHRLLAVREVGEVEEKIVLAELYSETLKASRNISNVAGIRHLFYFPYGLIRRLPTMLSQARSQSPTQPRKI